MTDNGFNTPAENSCDANSSGANVNENPRYALYFAPIHNDAWWNAGMHWLGRDAATNLTVAQPGVANGSSANLHQLTTDARRYGFHATLKAPFRLENGFSEAHLVAMAHSFSSLQNAFEVKDLGVHRLGNFLALQTTDPASKQQISALAMRCVRYFDLLRAPPTKAELTKRRKTTLSDRQEALLAQWGYQYTEEEYRFHLTLTDSLVSQDKEFAAAIRRAAEKCFSTAVATTKPFMIDGLTIFKESFPGAAMTIWKHFPFRPAPDATSIAGPDFPQQGRLFFVVGPSGVGKDALLQWVQARLPEETNVVFSQRCVTRPAHASEVHHVMTSDQFFQAEQGGAFSMTWQANETRYGIPRGIEADLKAGKDVVVNGSREYVPQLRQLFPNATVIWIVASPDIIRRRIENRQRESGVALENRLLRSVAFGANQDENIIYIDNSGPIDIAGSQLADIFSAKT
ncbi:phosphonate metabolism protein/1,5-bisphosphokinase (PRPP-forming) PhnN [Glaciimonas sp. PAMC28666]|uniref:phosphonate metabolism protein/1,5-bisphosphokinase (PRPP-forming) PhnN n=1 Tax=Glaciimonas sp. PAMC28666 TaxID=2807626 RepID=UPI001964204B|nr:phosphonate metabolism protein/1,5-bisphosphokinase (PRPP-forming) PhnN [Glaciimonas sp. PAMC28666]QRX84021.1 phosphonate metabolism protein/1,5-bisphosphokinase (PRPP-forming) PhnN [Glaciimonas sp. PAMC28666]